jgi:uncharacterized phage protein gp47/JayE
VPLDYPTRLDLYAIGRQHVLARAQRIDPSQVDVEGSDANIVINSASYIGFQVVLQLAQKLNALLLDGARGEDLDRYGYDRYGITRKGAAAAVDTVRFFRTSTAVGAGFVPENTKLATLTGIEYVTTAQATFDAIATDALATVRAITAGKSQQVGANTIRRIANPQGLFDPSLQVTNDEPAAGGEDAEPDEVFRERIRDFFRTARRGTISAIEFGARQVDGIETSSAQEFLTPLLNPARTVELFIADSSGVANSALATVVRQELEEYRAAGIPVIVNPSRPQIVPVALKLAFVAGTNTAEVTAGIRASVFNFVNSLPVNGPLYRAELFSVLQRFVPDGLIPSADTIAEPTGDLFPTTGTTLRTTLSDISVA